MQAQLRQFKAIAPSNWKFCWIFHKVWNWPICAIALRHAFRSYSTNGIDIGNCKNLFKLILSNKFLAITNTLNTLWKCRRPIYIVAGTRNLLKYSNSNHLQLNKQPEMLATDMIGSECERGIWHEPMIWSKANDVRQMGKSNSNWNNNNRLEFDSIGFGCKGNFCKLPYQTNCKCELAKWANEKCELLKISGCETMVANRPTENPNETKSISGSSSLQCSLS